MENAIKRNMSSEGFTAKKLAFIGLFGAVASVLMFLEFPLPFAPGFYKLDLSEVPVLIGVFALGPVSGSFIELIKILVHLVIKGTQTAGIGELANLVIGCAFVLPAALIYRAGKTRKRAVIGMITGTLVMTVAGCFMNAFVLLPAYATAFGMPMETLVGMGTAVNKAVHDVLTFAVLCVAPFNLVKGIVVSLITFFLYKHISTLIKSV